MAVAVTGTGAKDQSGPHPHPHTAAAPRASTALRVFRFFVLGFGEAHGSTCTSVSFVLPELVGGPVETRAEFLLPVGGLY
jgi:hypothetical protein